MNRTIKLSLTEQIQALTHQDLLQLRLVIDDLIKRHRYFNQSSTTKAKQPVLGKLSPLKPTGMPGRKEAFDRSQIYDDLAI